jgi:hypothetical protein
MPEPKVNQILLNHSHKSRRENVVTLEILRNRISLFLWLRRCKNAKESVWKSMRREISFFSCGFFDVHQNGWCSFRSSSISHHGFLIRSPFTSLYIPCVALRKSVFCAPKFIASHNRGAPSTSNAVEAMKFGKNC